MMPVRAKGSLNAKRSPRRGHSLIELMVSSALMGICMLGILALVKAGTRYLMVTQAKLDLQRDALIMMRNLAQEFSETNDVSFNVAYNPTGNDPAGQICDACHAGHDPNDTGPPWTPYPAGNSPANIFGVVFASPRSAVTGDIAYDAAGRMYWPKMVCYYIRTYQGIKCVAREVVRIADPTTYPPPVPSVGTFLSAPNPWKIVCKNVTLFHCQKGPSSLELHLRLDLPSGYGKRYGFEVHSQVFARN